ncbi:multiple sugar transport system permease protein [Fontibacillus panacisegetis]|uniref:Multiple sugar transport system permease protein n=1 Tax=Fontibacillus panacisegetis TaxID=670482 RepID=A0A1G7JPN0_9BACL|nr:sugar ABC transporter permease [Fontibacillus panacisegetis]SDF26902.1 multiple sugar transport system permease protein [Fontibacillus panacisegetis]
MAIANSDAAMMRRSARRKRRRENVAGLFFISPWLIGFLLLMFFPLMFSLVISFSEWNMVGSPKFIGFDNYVQMFTGDPFYFKSMIVTFKYVFIMVPLQVIFAILIAVLLNRATYGIRFFRAIFYLPSLIQGVTLALIFSWMLNDDFGPVNYMLELVGLPRVHWLTDPNVALYALIFIALWGVGSPMVLYLSALRSVSSEYYEAADIDGAGPLRKFLNITIPLITPTILFNILTSLISAFQTIVLAFVLTGGGPANSTYFYSLHVYRNAFTHFKMGYASAMAWAMFILIVVLTGLILKSSKYWVHYEADGGGR